jgi:glycosyltransferase involved in cell wall biosynthesis
MRIHFTYAGQPGSGQIQSPYSITDNLYQYLAARVEVIYHSWDATGAIDLREDDILLGHPNYNHDTIVQRAMSKPCRAKFLIFPFHHRRSEDNLPFDHLVKQATGVFSITGPYWYDTIEQTPFAHWKDKITRLDMAVDSNIYPYLKETFNSPGRRRLLYVGSSTVHKNLGYLAKIMSRMKDVELHWYGGYLENSLGRLNNVKVVGWSVMDRQLGLKICNDCDVMVNVSLSDANPTTLLETTAWGLIPACTKESGYYRNPMFHELFLDDIDKTIAVLRNLLNRSTADLKQQSLMNRQLVKEKYSWEVFCTKIWAKISSYV